jgi:hypothetical protein
LFSMVVLARYSRGGVFPEKPGNINEPSDA